mgnify:CR=1 FL=1
MQGTDLPEKFKSNFTYPPSWATNVSLLSGGNSQCQLLALAIAPLDIEQPLHGLSGATPHLSGPLPAPLLRLELHGNASHEHGSALQPGLDGGDGGRTSLKTQHKVMFRADRQAVYAGRQGLIADEKGTTAVGQITNLIICCPRLPARRARKPGPIGHQGEQNGQNDRQVHDFA